MDPATKRERVVAMFARLAPGYDRLNTVLSFGLHHRWRRVAVRCCAFPPGGRALDVGAGTADFIIATIGGSGTALGVDPCEPMLRVGWEKLRQRGIGERVGLVVGEAERLPVPDDAFDCATIGFTLRNVTDVDATFREMARAVKPGGRVVSLEIAKPEGWPMRPLFFFYFYRLSPWLAQAFGGERQGYEYLPDSLKAFKSRAELADIMRRAGLTDIRILNLTGGVVCVHVGTKPAARGAGMP
jgi:demethylmenaquinone methyltransferase/2-methoxy-6-polyprenyl-1,4-benzoquinol methylase